MCLVYVCVLNSAIDDWRNQAVSLIEGVLSVVEMLRQLSARSTNAGWNETRVFVVSNNRGWP
jgi:hypothetical protein